MATAKELVTAAIKGGLAIGKGHGPADPLLMLRGSGRQLWADEHADEYVRRLRKDSE